MTENQTLSGKVAIVTGAASGIGRAVVDAYLEAGARAVVAVDREEQPGGSSDPRLHVVTGDVSLEETLSSAADVARRTHGRIDVLVNNAAISVVKPLIDHTEEEWDAVFSVNIKSLYWGARAVVPQMKAQGGGVILNSGSISGVIGLPTQGAYAPTKGAVNQLTRQLAVELAPDNIRVNAICPGTVDTPLVRRSAEASGDAAAYMQMLESGHPLGRIASAEEIASYYVFYASDAASFCTGAIVMADGGFTAQ